MPDARNLRIPFLLRGIRGLIAVSVTANTDPDALGYYLLTRGQPTDAAKGFPVCRATVAYSPRPGIATSTCSERHTRSGSSMVDMSPPETAHSEDDYAHSQHDHAHTASHGCCQDIGASTIGILSSCELLTGVLGDYR